MTGVVTQTVKLPLRRHLDCSCTRAEGGHWGCNSKGKLQYRRCNGFVFFIICISRYIDLLSLFNICGRVVPLLCGWALILYLFWIFSKQIQHLWEFEMLSGFFSSLFRFNLNIFIPATLHTAEIVLNIIKIMLTIIPKFNKILLK